MAAKQFRASSITNLGKTADLVLALGFLMALVGAGKYALAVDGHPNSTGSVPAGAITERQLAINDALKKGHSTYTFTTNFIPGIGVITDPNAYKSELLKSLTTFAPGQ